VSKLAKGLKENDGTKKLGEFLEKHILQTVGAICYSITILFLAPARERTMWLMTGLAAAFLIPENSAYQYAYHCLALSCYLKARTKNARLLILASVVALWALGYVTFKK
jgi:hypothetical protein